MLSCQRDVAAMILHDAAAPMVPWVVIHVNDGDEEVIEKAKATHIMLFGDVSVVGDEVKADGESLIAVDLSGLTSLTQVGNRTARR